LEQNYPNPFNPTTKIKYSVGENVSEGETTSLMIYDILGNEVAVLLNEYKSPGEYEIEFNANSLSAGIYLYKITSGNFIAIKKLALVK